MAVTFDAVREWVERSCAEQGVPVAVTDPATLGRIGVLLGGAGAAPAGGAARPGLQPPQRTHAVRIEPSGGAAGADHGVVEDRGDDGPLPVEVEV